MMKFQICILALCFFNAVKTTLAVCEKSSPFGLCEQSCELEECRCNTTGEAKYKSCDQTCDTLYCLDPLNMMCVAEENCTQVCKPGSCNMTCHAEFCDQRADNGVKVMSCSNGNRCNQNCVDGKCEVMHCEADNCNQTCGKGGCSMKCTESVKMCFQNCLANGKCVLECRAEVCRQQCSGAAPCAIVNGKSSAVKTTLAVSESSSSSDPSKKSDEMGKRKSSAVKTTLAVSESSSSPDPSKKSDERGEGKSSRVCASFLLLVFAFVSLMLQRVYSV